MRMADGAELVTDRAPGIRSLRTPADARHRGAIAVEMARAQACLDAALRRPTPDGGTSATDGRDA